MSDSDVIEQAARVLSRAWGNMSTNDSLGRQRMLACALADAGLLARPLPDRDEIAEHLHADQCPEDPDPDECCTCDGTHYDRLADAVLELLT